MRKWKIAYLKIYEIFLKVKKENKTITERIIRRGQETLQTFLNSTKKLVTNQSEQVIFGAIITSNMRLILVKIENNQFKNILIK